MLVIKNIDKLVGEETGRYKIHSVKDFTKSYSFAVLDTDILRYFRIDLMKERIDGKWVLRYSPSRFIEIGDDIVKHKHQLFWHIINLVIKYRKPIQHIIK